MGHFGEQLVTVLTAIVGLAIIAVLVSKNAQTSSVLNAGFGGFANALRAATSPVTGTSGISTMMGPSSGFTSSFGQF